MSALNRGSRFRTCGDGPGDQVNERWCDVEVTLKESVICRAVCQVHDRFNVRPFWDLASFYRPTDHAAVLVAQWPNNAIAPDLGQGGVELGLGDEPTKRATRGSADDSRCPHGECFSQIAFKCPGVNERQARQVIVHECVKGERSLRGPAAIDGGLGYARPARHFFDAHGIKAPFRKDFCRGVQDGAVDLFITRPSSTQMFRARCHSHHST